MLSMKVNSLNHLEFGGCDVCELAKLVPYPLYILDESLLRANMKAYRLGLQKYYGNNSAVYYASKALMNLALCKIAQSENIGLDVASGGELYTAIKAGFLMKNLIFHGNNKSTTEITLALEHDVNRIIIDNLDEAEEINALCKEQKKQCNILLRVNPGIDAETHQYITTGTADSKFGIPIANQEAEKAIKLIKKLPHLNFKGIHCHIGSQIFSLEVYEKTLEVMAQFCKRLFDQQIKVDEFDFGGGLGIAYHPEDQPTSIDQYLMRICKRMIQEFQVRNLPLPKLMLEPGRSIVGETGITLYQAGTIKQVNGLTYVAVNGGMNDNIRTALYQARYHAVLANRMNETKDCKVKIVGKCCESGDILINEILLPKPKSGDLIALFSTGAYNYSMASNYNRLPIPGMLLVKNGTYEWIVRPQNFDDLQSNDLIPTRLAMSDVE